MPIDKHESRHLIGFSLWLLASPVLAFFLAGAVAFPILESYYATRVFPTLGLMAVVYGVECVMNWGTIETCGFLSGNCSTHNLYPVAVQIWQGLTALGLGTVAYFLYALRKRRVSTSE